MELKRHELWRLQYQHDRYLQYMDRNQLGQRFKDILNNVLTLSQKGQIGLHLEEESLAYWSPLLTHVLEEGELRGMDHRMLAGSEIQVPNATYPEIPKAHLAIENIIFPNPCLIKFGKVKYLKDMVEFGRFRMKPASEYSDPSLNRAQRDDELTITLELHPSRVQISHGILKGTVKPIGNVRYNITSQTDYYAFCMASSMALRLVDDFDADCCVVISKPDQFLRFFIDSCKKSLPREFKWRGFAFPVEYVDPCNPPVKEMDVYFTKHFRYWYQQEYRVTFIPNRPVGKLGFIDLEIGDLHDLCTIIEF